MLLANTPTRLTVKSAIEMEALGVSLSKELKPGDIFTLEGELGAGKTTLVRGVLQGLGWKNAVKSPTYGLIETYPLKHITLFHIDAYRLHTPEAGLSIGLEDCISKDAIVLIEWPEKLGSYLPKVSVTCKINVVEESRLLELVRNFHEAI